MADSKQTLILFDEGQRGFEKIRLKRFKKDAIRVGEFVHPKTGRTVEVTPDRIEAWADAFGRMKSAGIGVPFPYDHSGASKDNAGFVQDMFCEDGRLMFVVDVPKAEDAQNMGATIREVSVSITPDFVDGTGRHWGEVIDHIAPCTYPVVTHQDNFEEMPITARCAQGADDAAPIYCRAQKENTMDKDRLAQLLGLTPDEVADDPDGQIEQTRATLRAERNRAEAADEEIARLRARIEALEKDARPEPVSPEMEAVEAQLRAVNEELADGKIARYLRDGKLTPAMAEAGDVKALLLGQRITLSIDGEDTCVREAFERFMEALPKGACLDMEARAAQLRAVERPTSGLTEDEAETLAKENVALVQG